MNKGFSLSSFPRGLHSYEKGAFDVRGLIQLSGIKGDGLPESKLGINVGLKEGKLYFLQGSAGEVESGTK